MNDPEEEKKARQALIFIYQQTTLQCPTFTYERIVQAMGVTGLPESIQGKQFANQEDFIAELEYAARVVSDYELQGAANLSLTINAFETQMRAWFRGGELQVTWAQRYKDARQTMPGLQQFQNHLRSLEIG